MAKTNSYTDQHGTVHPNTYADVISVCLEHTAEIVTIMYGIFADQAAHDNSITPLVTYPYSLGKEAIDEVLHPTTGVLLREAIPAYSEYFSDAILDAANIKPVDKAREYVEALEPWASWTDV